MFKKAQLYFIRNNELKFRVSVKTSFGKTLSKNQFEFGNFMLWQLVLSNFYIVESYYEYQKIILQRVNWKMFTWWRKYQQPRTCFRPWAFPLSRRLPTLLEVFRWSLSEGIRRSEARPGVCRKSRIEEGREKVGQRDPEKSSILAKYFLREIPREYLLEALFQGSARRAVFRTQHRSCQEPHIELRIYRFC